MTRPATKEEVIYYYKNNDCVLKIDKKGHVEYKHESDEIWLEGRWLKEYKFNSYYGVHI